MGACCCKKQTSNEQNEIIISTDQNKTTGKPYQENQPDRNTQQQLKKKDENAKENKIDDRSKAAATNNQSQLQEGTSKLVLDNKGENVQQNKIIEQNKAAGATNQYEKPNIITGEQLQNQNKQFQWKGQKKILLLGQPGVGKSSLFKQLSNKREQIKDFQEYEFSEGNQNYCIIKTMDFDFESDIDEREKQIIQIQKYTDQNPQIYSFLIIVNFERTDLMKKKVMSVYKFLNKFKDRIFLGVTKFELSEDQEADEKHLKEKFDHMIKQDRILFFKNNDKKEDLQKKIVKKMTEILQKEQLEEQIFQNIDFTDTIFEKINESEQNRMMNDIVRNLPNNRGY